jgi:hypothetical protein
MFHLASLSKVADKLIQFPIMLAGTVICSIGTGLLIIIGIETPTAVWAAFMAAAGLGDGMCTNLPYSAIQAILDE